MTRALPLAAAAMLVVSACSAPDTPEASDEPTPAAVAQAPLPATVHILLAGPGNPEVQAWAQELAAAIQAGHGDLALVPTPEEAEQVVLIEDVETGAATTPEPSGEGPTYRMKGSLIIGEDAREFSLAYRGEVRPQAEALARNLLRFAQEAAAAGATEDPEDAVAPDTDAEPQSTDH